MFTAEATGTGPLSYQWKQKSVMDDGEWQPCDVEKFPGADSSTVVISSVQKSNEGSYRCVVCNCAGSQASNPAKLSVGECTTETFTKKYNVLHGEYQSHLGSSPGIVVQYTHLMYIMRPEAGMEPENEVH